MYPLIVLSQLFLRDQQNAQTVHNLRMEGWNVLIGDPELVKVLTKDGKDA